MTYNPRTYIQQLAAEAADIVAQLGQGWTHEGAIIRHESGAVILLLNQVAVAPENVRRVSLEDMTTAQIVAVARTIAPTTYWLTEYGDDEGGWEPTYYAEHESEQAAERYCDQVAQYVAGDLRISKVVKQVVSYRKRT
jgi:hypothetical protein